MGTWPIAIKTPAQSITLSSFVLLFFAGPYFLLTDNRSALVLWCIVIVVTILWKALEKTPKHNFGFFNFLKNSHQLIEIIISFFLKGGGTQGELYCATIISP